MNSFTDSGIKEDTERKHSHCLPQRRSELSLTRPESQLAHPLDRSQCRKWPPAAAPLLITTLWRCSQQLLPSPMSWKQGSLQPPDPAPQPAGVRVQVWVGEALLCFLFVLFFCCLLVCFSFWLRQKYSQGARLRRPPCNAASSKVVYLSREKSAPLGA